MSPHPLRSPVSTRHAFALAFDLAVRRDPLQSLIVPLLLRAPWIVAIAMLPPLEDADQPLLIVLLSTFATAGDFLMLLVTSAMQRFRARSVFNTPAAVHPAPAIECYSRGLARLPWLLLTEIVRNVCLVFATFFFVLPGVILGFRLSFSTEAVVLNEDHMASAFQRSFHLTERRFERWFEMVAASVLIVLSAVLTTAVLAVAIQGVEIATWLVVMWMLLAALTPIIQYAWTFFYLRLVEVDIAPGVEVGPLYAGPEVPAAGFGPRPESLPPVA